jgi:hypothetical protein
MARLAPVLTNTFPVTVALFSWQVAPSGTTTLPLITPSNNPVQGVLSARAAGSAATMIPNAISVVAKCLMVSPLSYDYAQAAAYIDTLLGAEFNHND